MGGGGGGGGRVHEGGWCARGEFSCAIKVFFCDVEF